MEFGKNNTPFATKEFAERLTKTKAKMADAGLDALVVSDPANMNYLSGYDGWSFYVHQCVIVGQDHRAAGVDRPRSGRERRQAHDDPPARKHRRLHGRPCAIDHQASHASRGAGAEGPGPRRQADRCRGGLLLFHRKGAGSSQARAAQRRVRRRGRPGELGARGEVEARDRSDDGGRPHRGADHADRDRRDRRRRAAMRRRSGDPGGRHARDRGIRRRLPGHRAARCRPASARPARTSPGSTSLLPRKPAPASRSPGSGVATTCR